MTGNGPKYGTDELGLYVEIRGAEGSTAVCRKRINNKMDVSSADIVILESIARCLPPELFDAFCEPDTIELMLNPDGSMYWETLGGAMVEMGHMDHPSAEGFIRQIAGYLKKTVTRDQPLLEDVFPLDDSRFAGQLPPVVAHPSFAIRKRAIRVFTLDDYISSGVMSARQGDMIRQAVRGRRNILIIGGTGTGKTTLGNAVLHEITLSEPHARQIIIEDTAELQSTAANRVNFQVSDTTSMTDLIKTTLRMRPDRVIVGEVRGPEAFDLLQAWNTGHPGGVATLHANNCRAGLRRLKSLVSQHEFAPRDIEPDIALAVNLMVNIVKRGHGRRVREIVAVRGYDPAHRKNGGYRLERLE